MNEKSLALIYEGMPDKPDGSVDVQHFFGAGHYVRLSNVPAGQVVRMHVHNYAHKSMVIVGKGRLMTSQGTRPINAGETILVPAGVKHAYLADANTIWACIHPSHEDEAKDLYGTAP